MSAPHLFSVPAALLAAALLASTVSAQTDERPGPELVDRVVAVVGDSIVLASQVEEEIQRLRATGQPVPSEPEALDEVRREIVADFVDHLLILQAAQRDTMVQVSEERVSQTFRQAWEDQVQRFGSEARLREVVEEGGQTLPQYRATLRDQIQRELLLQSYIQSRRASMQGVPVDESEVREFFERERERLGERPATLTIQQLFFQPQASDSAKAAARERAEEILAMVRAGDDFASLARRFSDDPGSRQQGGDLGWHRRGDGMSEGLVEEFEDAAFRLREGQVSNVVETGFGAHIIKVERIRGPERRIHHILVAAEPTPADEGRLRERVEEIAREVREGRPLSDFSGEATRFGIPDSVAIAREQLEQLPEPYARALQGASEGDVVGPVGFSLQEEVSVYAIARVLEAREAGAFTFEDVRDEIRRNLREQKFGERLISELRARTYVEIRL